jgi:hypothetical protein
MTAQFHDLFRYQAREFSVVGVDHELFKPSDFQLSPIPASTACWRGTLALYTILDVQLILETLSVNLPTPQGPMINGIPSSGRTGRYTMFNNVYQNLNISIPYTGSILLGTDFIRELYVHMGFHPAWKYNTVIELIFENGKLIRESDISEAMARLRQTMQDQIK